MVKNCCVEGCTSFWYPGSEKSFHLFPFKNEDRLKKWMDIVPTKGKVGKYSYVCSLHFLNTDYTSTSGGVMMLKKSAVPSRFNMLSSSQMETDIVTPNIISVEIISQEVDSVDKEETPVEVPSVSNKRKLPPSEREDKLRRKIKILQAKLKRKEAKLQNMETLVKVLKKEGNCTDQLEHLLLRRFSGFNLDILKNELKNDACPKSRRRYEDKIKDFAATVYFYSPKAYNFLRTKLHLPDEATIRKMISGNSCEPGFVNGVFDYVNSE